MIGKRVAVRPSTQGAFVCIEVYDCTYTIVSLQLAWYNNRSAIYARLVIAVERGCWVSRLVLRGFTVVKYTDNRTPSVIIINVAIAIYIYFSQMST